jgi:8-oxo-dGTP pyrophosphatase MutT (NUDIX family)
MNSAAVIIEDRDDCVLLLLRGPTAPWMPYRWNLPGGMIDPGETSMDAAAREAREETGLRVQSLVPLTRMRTRGGELDVFYTKHWSGQVQLLDGEHISYAWVPREEAIDWDLVPNQRKPLLWLARL